MLVGCERLCHFYRESERDSLEIAIVASNSSEGDRFVSSFTDRPTNTFKGQTGPINAVSQKNMYIACYNYD